MCYEHVSCENMDREDGTRIENEAFFLRIYIVQ